MTSLFANPAPNQSSSGLFNTASNNQGRSLFGGTTTQPPQSTLFRSTSQPAQTGSGLFGASTPQPAQTGGGLFGASTSQPAQTGGGLFGASTSQPAQTGGGLFGASTSQPAQTGGGLFGASNTRPQPTTNTSLFGAASQPQPQPNQTPSLFGAQPAQNQGGGLFGSSQQPQPQQAPGGLGPGVLSAGLNASTGVGALSAQTQLELAQSRLQSAGLNSSAREKTVPQQIATLVQKWDPSSSDTLLQAYLYNAANPAFAPFYYPAPNESEREYEAALAKKPEPVDGNTWVPLLVRGFKSLGERIEYQAKFVQNMQVRLHEMNNALAAIMQKHAQELSVRVDAAKRQHVALSQRTLRLAVKCQVLRNRGYALDAQEEGLRTTLLELQKNAQDPNFSSREEEIWARMVMLRERVRWLEEEGKKVGTAVNAQGVNGTGTVPDNVIEGAKRILRDYDSQLRQLARELQAVQKELKEWEESR